MTSLSITYSYTIYYSLVNKLSMLQSFVYSSSFDVICITETDFIYDKEILPYKFTFYRRDRGSRGGGVLIAVNDNLPSILIPSPPNLEVVSISLCLPVIQISICTVYIPPNPDVAYFNQLIDFLLTLSSNCEFLIVIGDFNRPDICWSSLSGTSLLSNLLCDFVFESNLSQLITCPTHVKGNILDILLTNNDHLITGLSVTESHSSLPSDHYNYYFLQH